MYSDASSLGAVVGFVVVVVVASVVGATALVGVTGVTSAQESSDTLYVDSTPATFCGPVNATENRTYRTIQEAVDASDAGGTVVVCDGNPYDGGVTVDKPLKIEGSGSGPVVLTGGASNTGITVQSSASGTVISGLRMSGFSSVGVSVESASNVTVTNTTFDITGTTVEATDASDVTVSGIEVTSAETGVSAEDTSGLAVENATFDVSETGVALSGTTGTTVRGVDVTDADAGVAVDGSSGLAVLDSTFDDLDGSAVNLTNAGDVFVRNVTVTDSPRGVVVTATGGEAVSNVTVRDTDVEGTESGVLVTVSTGGTRLSGLTLSGLALSENDRGIEVTAADNSTVTDLLVEASTVTDSEERGIGISVTSGIPTVRNVTLRNLTVDGSGDAEGISVSAGGGGLIRDLVMLDSTITSNDVGLTLLDEEGRVEDVLVFRNQVTESRVGVLLGGDSTSTPFNNVSVRQNLVERSRETGVLVETRPSRIDVTRNVVRDNGVGIENRNTNGDLSAWLNYWGEDSGPSGGDEDPLTDTPANGAGDEVAGNVRFDPWLGKGACAGDGLASVVDGPFELYGEQVGLAETQSFCAWDRAPLALRPDPAGAAVQLDGPNVSYALDGAGAVPANRSGVTVYEAGVPFDLRFGVGGTDTSQFAGADTQLLVVRDPDSTNASFDVGFDESTGETVLRTDAEFATVVDAGSVDLDGELEHTYRPPASGSYTFVLLTSDFGPGASEVSGRAEVRLDGGASVVGVETVVVREAPGSAEPVGGNTTANASVASYPAGSDVAFEVDSGLGDGRTDHAVLLYDESRYRNATTTVEVDASTADLIAGEVEPDDVTVESSISRLYGVYRAPTAFAALGVEIESRNESGPVDPTPFVGLGTGLYDVAGADRTNATGAVPLNGSVVVVRSDGPEATATVETLSDFPPGTYRYVYVAERGRDASLVEGTIELTEPTAAPTPSPTPGGGSDDDDDDDSGGGGGGGGGAPPAGPTGDVEITDRTLLNETVSAGSEAVVRVNLSNTDPTRGVLTLNLSVDGTVLAEQQLAVAASTDRTVFVRTGFGTPGTYLLGVNGVEVGTVTVTAAASPTSTPGPTPAVPATPTPAPTTDPGTDTETQDETPTAIPATPTATPPLPSGADAPSGTDTVVGLGLSLLLLYGVGVAVYVLREQPP